MHRPAVSLSFEPQPVLQGQRVRLRPLTANDWDELYACAADPLIWEQHLMLTHAFCFVDEVLFEIGINNLRSRRAIEKLGARPLRKEDLDQNTHVVYGIHRADYANRCSLI